MTSKEIEKAIAQETEKALKDIRAGGSVQLVAVRIAVKLVNRLQLRGEDRRRLYFRIIDAAEGALYEIAEFEGMREKALAEARR